MRNLIAMPKASFCYCTKQGSSSYFQGSLVFNFFSFVVWFVCPQYLHAVKVLCNYSVIYVSPRKTCNT